VWVGHGVEQFPIENRPGAILAFTYIFISVSLFTLSFTRCSVTIQMFHRVLIAGRGAFSIVIALHAFLAKFVKLLLPHSPVAKKTPFPEQMSKVTC
jgi:hypothetical protein